MAKVEAKRFRISLFDPAVIKIIESLSTKQRSLFIEAAIGLYLKANEGETFLKTLRYRSPESNSQEKIQESQTETDNHFPVQIGKEVATVAEQQFSPEASLQPNEPEKRESFSRRIDDMFKGLTSA